MKTEALVVRAVRTRQDGHDVYAFFVAGDRLLKIANVRPLAPSTEGRLEGFQRPTIRAQVRAIGEYLAQGPRLFPNAIILALGPEARFTAARGTRPTDVDVDSDTGTLTIPLSEDHVGACIVDGQQRTLALADTAVRGQTVPVVAFVSDDLNVQREQFILVNKARPLPARLIDELLPEVNARLPRDLSARKIPSALCGFLNDARESPFRGIIKRPSFSAPCAVITDSSLVGVMSRSIKDPRGALAAHISRDSVADVHAMLRVMVTFWTAVRDVFSAAWGLPPDRSRLMHAAGIKAMGVLMDQIMTYPTVDPEHHALATLSRIAPSCRWTAGRWEPLDRDWNDIQDTPRDVRLLANLLVALERSPSGKSM